MRVLLREKHRLFLPPPAAFLQVVALNACELYLISLLIPVSHTCPSHPCLGGAPALLLYAKPSHAAFSTSWTFINPPPGCQINTSVLMDGFSPTHLSVFCWGFVMIRVELDSVVGILKMRLECTLDQTYTHAHARTPFRRTVYLLYLLACFGKKRENFRAQRKPKRKAAVR